jgi:hypothetical protein
MRSETVRTLAVLVLASMCIGASGAASAYQFGRALQGCVTKSYYLSHGGKLILTVPPDFEKMAKANPDLFSKRGRLIVNYGGYIDTHGVTDVMATDHSNTCYPGEPRRISGTDLVDLAPCTARMAAFDVLIGGMRYSPPILFGKPACVIVSWEVLYDHYGLEVRYGASGKVVEQ